MRILYLQIRTCKTCPHLQDDGRDDPWCKASGTTKSVPYDEDLDEFDYTIPTECPLPEAF